jgi:hypothetical protein
MRGRGRQFVQQLSGFAARLRNRVAGRGSAGVRAGGMVRAAWPRCVFTLAGGGLAGVAGRVARALLVAPADPFSALAMARLCCIRNEDPWWTMSSRSRYRDVGV